MLRMALVAHGRFHAFDLARELRRLGHDVDLFGNYPAWAVERFGVDADGYRGLWLHGGVERVLDRLAPRVLRRTEAPRHRWFGRWAARALEGRDRDVVLGWSGVSEELLGSTAVRAPCRVLMRGSAHIVEQAALLDDEARRTGVAIEHPSAWMVEREQREYHRADHIVVLSEFARASFERHGVAAHRLSVLPLGVDVERFRAPAPALRSRTARVLDGGPIQVLFVGTLSARKGMKDLAAVARRCAHLPIAFTLVGPEVRETRAVLGEPGPNVTILERRAQESLPDVYAQADLFLFPTIEDGFGMVLTQAAAAGLVLLATDHCAAPELIAAGAQGWTVPIRDVDAMADRLEWCHVNRAEFVAMLTRASVARRTRSWSDVASAFAGLAETWTSAAERQ